MHTFVNTHLNTCLVQSSSEKYLCLAYFTSLLIQWLGRCLRCQGAADSALILCLLDTRMPSTSTPTCLILVRRGSNVVKIWKKSIKQKLSLSRY